MTYAAPINAIDNLALAAERWYQFSEVATAKTEATYHWYVNTFIGTEAVRRYEDIGTIIGVVMCYAIGAGMLTRAAWEWFIAAQQLPAVALVQPVAIEDDLPSLPELLEVAAENPDQWLIDLADKVAAHAAAHQHPTVVEFLEAMTTPVLRRECSERGIAWKNARGKNRHMTKAQMVEAIAAKYPQGADGPLWHHAA